MAQPEPQAEPSMEEILASIRRIISEEDEAPAATLDLTQAEPAAAIEEDDIVFETVETVAQAAPAPPALEPAPAPVTVAPAPAQVIEPAAETILSPPTANAAAGALARLAGTLRIADREGQTIEGVVRELLKPMLKEWLDRNLPAIVESRVEAELERIARLAR